MNFNNYRTVNPNTPISPKQKKIIRNAIIAIIILILIFILFSTSYYTVNDKQKAVVTTFGKVTSVTDAGMHFKLPFGIQQCNIQDVNIFRKIEIGFATNDASGEEEFVPSESKMITGDFNIVNVDFLVEYRISDIVKFLYSSLDSEVILKNVAQSQIRNIISSFNVDEILTDKKGEIQMKIKTLIQAELERFDLGLLLNDVKILDAEPPTVEVIEAFKSVETAKQDKETAINDARAYENANIPKAKSREDQLIQNAEFLKQNRINDAKKQVAMFNAMYDQYKLNPPISKQRMYYEMIEQVFPGIKVYIDTSDGSGISKLLPLEDFNGNNTNSITPVTPAE